MLSIDLHGYKVDEAYEKLIDFIDEAYEAGEMAIEVIHGYTRGQELKKMVSELTAYDHEAIAKVEQSFKNAGSTKIFFKIR